MDMARRARAAAAAQREQLVEARVADILHHGQARVAFDLMLGPVARNDNQLGHASPSSVSCRRRYVARDRQSTRLNSSTSCAPRLPSSACTKKKNTSKYV